MRESSTPPVNGATPEHWEDARAFYQKRVARFSLFGTALAATMSLVFIAVPLVLGRYELFARPVIPVHAIVALGALIPWLLLRKRARSEVFIQRVEVIGVLASCWSYAFLGLIAPFFARADLIGVLALTYMMVARAVYVPSSPRRTFSISAAAAVPSVVVTFFSTLHVPAGILDEARAMIAGIGAEDVHRVVTLLAASFHALTVFVATGVSRVIYGLRAEVKGVRQLGQYTLREKLGEGGMGVVYRADHAMLRRPTAIKLLPAHRSSEAAIARFEREVQLTARLTHPNTVTIFDYGRTRENVFYYAMELIDGLSIAELVEKEGAQPPARVLHILRQVAGALGEAHAHGLIHRDVKSANIMLCERGGTPDIVKVLDFGLVKELSGESALLTRADIITGTPMYISPEAICAPEKVDARSDLYSLAAVGYHLLTGRDVFPGTNAVEVCSHHLHSKPQHPSSYVGHESDDLAAVLLRGLEKDPAARFASAEALIAALDRCAAAGRWRDADGRAWWTSRRRMQTSFDSGNAAPAKVDEIRAYPVDRRKAG